MALDMTNKLITVLVGNYCQLSVVMKVNKMAITILEAPVGCSYLY
jgi:hypothetical protein